MKLLSLDIETTPSLAYVWQLWDQNIGLNQVKSTTEVLCFAAKFLDERKVHFYSSRLDGQEGMIEAAHSLLDQADCVMTYNGNKFDLPHLNREFVQLGLTPPSPYQKIDLYLVARKQFRFLSNKLEHVSKELGLAGKVQHTGFELWKGCLAGDEKAWRLMRKYNIQDVKLLGDLYEILKPWITNHPNLRLFDGITGCSTCGSSRVTSHGLVRTKVSEYRRYRCQDCGTFTRGTKRVRGVNSTSIPL